ncbi:NADP-dependent isocitrate dehydrogenase [Actinacidiphila glaucinigra]|uniref:NADP-dependent isocitrate dehydrogenase n=1 Tax=Actinacidiphila glaucinigra TaxID=235986 RepID=UPI0035DFAC14
MTKIKARNPVVELDGDEMARIIWRFIRDELVLPYLDIGLVRFDLGIEHRDATHDRVTAEAAEAVARHGVGVKCATVTPDEARVAEFGLKGMYRSPNATIRDRLGGGIFREPVVLRNVPRAVPGGTRPVVIARHAFGDQYRATELRIPGAGTLALSFTPADGSDPVDLEVHHFPGPGVALGMVNLDESIREFARAAFRYGLARGLPVHLSTKNTVLRKYDGRFKDLFQEVFDTEFRREFEASGLGHEHRQVDDMAASALKGAGGYVWACKNYDGDILSGVLARGVGSAGLMTSLLMTSDGRTVVSEAAHGTVTRHYRRHQAGRPTSTNPIAMVFAWSRGLAHRARLDDTPELARFAGTLESACLEVVEAGQLTQDLAVLVSPEQPWLTTEQFLAAVDENLRKRMSG